jgi:small subunit ribosomal protein S3
LGQKVNPIGFRVTVTKDWRSRWYANSTEFGDLLHEDLKVRDYVEKYLAAAGVPDVKIERFSNRINLVLRTSRPGIIIGRRGSEIERIRDELSNLTGKEVFIDVEEIKRPELEAKLVAANIALQLSHRVSFRRAMKKAVSTAMDFGAEGIKVQCAGRLGGAEMSRTEGYKEGKIPLHTLRADIDYGFIKSNTTYGVIGVKVWIFKGEKLPEKKGNINAVNAKKS